MESMGEDAALYHSHPNAPDMCQDLISVIVTKVSNDIIWCFVFFFKYFFFNL